MYAMFINPYLLSHDARDLALALRLPVSWLRRRIDVKVLLQVLLRELEVRVLLIDRRAHGHVVAGAASRSKDEARRELRTS